VIPALNPGRKLIDLVIDLQAAGFERIILVNDGSGDSYENIFSQLGILGCSVVRHPKNMGKGAALKSGIREAVNQYGYRQGIITADSDGQHCVSDIVKIDEAMNANPGKLILGTRDFDSKNVPLKSRFGNKITSSVFGLTCGKKCPDTQTGLRGIPEELLILALYAEGTRYEYEMNFLCDAAETTAMVYVPVQTIYEDGNRGSHFRPIRDSVLIYARFMRFLISSFAGAIADFLVFSLMLVMLPLFGLTSTAYTVITATVIARLISGAINFTMNKKYAFKSKGDTAGEGIRYFILFISQMGASAALVSALSLLINPVAAKVIVDCSLFLVSYVVQRRWVFRPQKASAKHGIKSYRNLKYV
jgi:glycosyltransferase involved in cell wall biosynthesis